MDNINKLINDLMVLYDKAKTGFIFSEDLKIKSKYLDEMERICSMITDLYRLKLKIKPE